MLRGHPCWLLFPTSITCRGILTCQHICNDCKWFHLSLPLFSFFLIKNISQGNTAQNNFENRLFSCLSHAQGQSLSASAFSARAVLASSPLFLIKISSSISAISWARTMFLLKSISSDCFFTEDSIVTG